MRDPAWFMDADCRHLIVNAAWCRATGIQAKDAIGKTPHDLMPPAVAARTVAAAQEAMASGNAIRHEQMLEDRQGGNRCYSSNISVLRNRDGKALGTVGSSHDITAEKEAELKLIDLNATLKGLVAEQTSALAESTANLLGISENAPVGILVLGQTHFVFANQHAARILGYTVEEFEQVPISDAIHPDYREMMTEQALRRLAGEDVRSTYEAIALAKDGREVPIELHAAVTLWNGQRVVMVFVADITARKRAEQALSENEFNLRAVMDNAPVGITMFGDGHYSYVNRHAAKTLGYAAEELVRMSYFDLLHPDERPAAHDRHRRRLAGETPPSTYETIVLPKDGRQMRIEIRTATTIWNGRPTVMAFAIDITARKQAEDDLRQSEARFRSLVVASADVIWHADATGNPIGENLSWCAFTGQKTEHLRTGCWQEAFHPDGLVRVREILSLATAQKSPYQIDTRLRRFDGEWRDVAISVVPVIGEDGIVRELMASCTDITQQRLLQEQLAAATKLEAIGKLTGGMAHDFNNYLGVIIGNLDLLKAGGNLGEAASRLLDGSLKGAWRAAELTRSLLAFARRQPLAPQVVQVSGPIAATIDLLTRTVGEQITIRADLAVDLWPTLIDVSQLESSIVNLATNARDAMPHGGTVTISTRNVTLNASSAAATIAVAPGDYILIEVADAGAGMPPEVLAQVFEPFFTTKGAGHGTGLGLSMVYGFIKQSGGHIRINSAIDQGTVVRIYLPRTEDTPIVTPVARSRKALPGGAETILLVEDNEILREVTRAQLASLGYHIIEAENGPAAMQTLSHGQVHVDLFYTDIVMPGQLNGYELAKRARIASGPQGNDDFGLPGRKIADGRGRDPRLHVVEQTLPLRGPRPDGPRNPRRRVTLVYPTYGGRAPA